MTVNNHYVVDGNNETKIFKSANVGGVQYVGHMVFDATGNNAVGNVAATPGANTILDRLKKIEDALYLNLNVNLANNAVTMNVLPDTTTGDLASIAADMTSIEGAMSGVDKLRIVIADTTGSEIDPLTSTTPWKHSDVSNTALTVKNIAGELHWLHAFNTTASPLWLKIYNKPSANIIVGSNTSALLYMIPTLATTNGVGFALTFGTGGVSLNAGISIACTTALADSDTGKPSANACIINLGYT